MARQLVRVVAKSLQRWIFSTVMGQTLSSMALLLGHTLLWSSMGHTLYFVKFTVLPEFATSPAIQVGYGAASDDILICHG